KGKNRLCAVSSKLLAIALIISDLQSKCVPSRWDGTATRFAKIRAKFLKNCFRYGRGVPRSNRTGPFLAEVGPRSSRRHREYRPCRRPRPISGSPRCAGSLLRLAAAVTKAPARVPPPAEDRRRQETAPLHDCLLQLHDCLLQRAQTSAQPAAPASA